MTSKCVTYSPMIQIRHVRRIIELLILFLFFAHRPSRQSAARRAWALAEAAERRCGQSGLGPQLSTSCRRVTMFISTVSTWISTPDLNQRSEGEKDGNEIRNTMKSLKITESIGPSKSSTLFFGVGEIAIYYLHRFFISTNLPGESHRAPAESWKGDATGDNWIRHWIRHHGHETCRLGTLRYRLLENSRPTFMGLFYGKVIEQQMMDFPAMCDYQRLDIFNQRYTVPYPHCRPSRIALRRGPMLICKPMQAPPRQAEKRSNDSTLACIYIYIVSICTYTQLTQHACMYVCIYIYVYITHNAVFSCIIFILFCHPPKKRLRGAVLFPKEVAPGLRGLDGTEQTQRMVSPRVAGLRLGSWPQKHGKNRCKMQHQAICQFIFYLCLEV